MLARVKIRFLIADLLMFFENIYCARIIFE